MFEKLRHNNGNDEEKLLERLNSANGDAEEYYNIGLGFLDCNNQTKAIDCLQKAVEAKKDYQQAWEKLGMIYYDREEHAWAREIFLTILKINGSNFLALKHLGLVFYKERHYNYSGTYLKKALLIKSDDHIIWYHLGLLAAAEKEYTIAINYMKNALKIKPNFRDARKEVNKLEKIL